MVGFPFLNVIVEMKIFRRLSIKNTLHRLSCLAATWSECGLSMVECMLALLILTIVIIGVGVTTPANRDTYEVMEEERIALLLARQMMEEIQSKSFEDPDFGAGTFGREETVRARV